MVDQGVLATDGVEHGIGVVADVNLTRREGWIF